MLIRCYSVHLLFRLYYLSFGDSSDYGHHTGTDLGAPLGTPVAATLGMKRLQTFRWLRLTAILDHKNFTQQNALCHSQKPLSNLVSGSAGNCNWSRRQHRQLHWPTSTLKPADDTEAQLTPGAEPEYALAQDGQSLRTAQSPQRPRVGKKTQGKLGERWVTPE